MKHLADLCPITDMPMRGKEEVVRQDGQMYLRVNCSTCGQMHLFDGLFRIVRGRIFEGD